MNDNHKALSRCSLTVSISLLYPLNQVCHRLLKRGPARLSQITQQTLGFVTRLDDGRVLSAREIRDEVLFRLQLPEDAKNSVPADAPGISEDPLVSYVIEYGRCNMQSSNVFGIDEVLYTYGVRGWSLYSGFGSGADLRRTVIR